MTEPEPPAVPVDATLQEQEQILAEVASGYGREQLLRHALQLAAEEVLKQTRLMGRHTGETADELVMEYLVMAQADLAEEDEADA